VRKISDFNQRPLGQALLATILFCFIFVALFAGLYKAGTAYVIKEKSRTAANMTALTAGAVYANGLELVRYSNDILMVLVTLDAIKVGLAVAPFTVAPPPIDFAGAIATAKAVDAQNLRTPFQKIQDRVFGVETPPGAYPLLIEGQAVATAGENGLSSLPPIYAYNYETAKTAEEVVAPNMALRFRRASDLLPDIGREAYSLKHNGLVYHFSEEQVEPANNPRHPHQMRVKKTLISPYAGWWVKKEEGSGSGPPGASVLNKIGGNNFLNHIREFLDGFKMDVVDRDDPPCHTFSLLGDTNGTLAGLKRNFYQAAEVRVETDGLAGWDTLKPFDIYLQKVDIGAFPILKEGLKTFASIPIVNQILKNSDVLNGL
jgi:hypothetical protein